MSVIYVLSLICDISLYMAFVGVLFPAQLSSTAMVFVPLFIIPAVALLAKVLYRIRPMLRFFPIILLSLCFIFTENAVAVTAILVPCIYITGIVVMKYFSFDIDWLRGKVKLCAVIVFIPIIMVMINGYAYLASSYYLSFALIHVCCALCIMRISRIDLTTGANLKFILLNLALVVGCFAVLAVIGSPQVLTAVWESIRFLFQHFIVPAVLFCINTLNRLFPAPDVVGEYELGVMVKEKDLEAIQKAAEQDGDILSFHPAVLLIPIAVLAFYIIRKLLRRPRRQQIIEGIAETRSTITLVPEKKSSDDKQRLFTPRNPRLAIRHHYRQFLKICTAKGYQSEKGDTSKDVNTKNKPHFSGENLTRLRELYIKARYSEHNIASKESKEAGEIVKRM